MARAIRVDGDRVTRHFEQPWLCVVRAGRKDGSAKGSSISVLVAAAPLVPRRVCRTGRTGKHAAIPRSISECRNRRGSASNDYSLALHKSLPAPRLAPRRGPSLLSGLRPDGHASPDTVVDALRHAPTDREKAHHDALRRRSALASRTDRPGSELGRHIGVTSADGQTRNSPRRQQAGPSSSDAWCLTIRVVRGALEDAGPQISSRGVDDVAHLSSRRPCSTFIVADRFAPVRYRQPAW